MTTPQYLFASNEKTPYEAKPAPAPYHTNPTTLKPGTRTVINTNNLAAEQLEFLVDLEKEHFVVLHLNARTELLQLETVSMGTKATCPVDPSDVFRSALLSGAHAIILAHNHPSGDPSASLDDINLTKRFCEVGKLINVEVLDHIIVASRGHVSLTMQGIIKVKQW